jgi:hypothetical protein
MKARSLLAVAVPLAFLFAGAVAAAKPVPPTAPSLGVPHVAEVVVTAPSAGQLTRSNSSGLCSARRVRLL